MRWRALALDVVVAAAALALSAAALAQDRAGAAARDPDLLAYALVAVYSASAALRRLSPAAAVAVVVVSGVAFAGADYPEALTPVGLLPVYTAGAVLPSRASRTVLAVAVAGSALGATLGSGPTNASIPIAVLAVWLLGTAAGARRAYTAELEHKNRLLEEAQRELAEQAVTEERLRIARELHDVVAHTMTVVALHAGTGRMVAEEDPAAARQALATIETSTRSALAEMRRLLGVLRGGAPGDPAEPGGDLAPAPGLADVEALVADVARSGITADLRIEGERDEVPPGVDLSAYRIVQEALTNVIKHAGSARVSVVVRYEPQAVTVEVDDDGGRPVPRPAALAAAPAAPAAGGHGLVGMRERVAMHDGSLDVGPRPEGGFRVVARLPYPALT